MKHAPRSLDHDTATSFGRLALTNVDRRYPHKLDHLLADGPEPLAADHVALHPVFHGSYDWHSAVHMHWLLVRIVRLHPTLPIAATIVNTLDGRLASGPLEAELAYVAGAAGKTFERPYGWAWLLALRAEIERLGGTRSEARAWAAAIDPLARHLAARLQDFVATAAYPIRSGTHSSTAFAALLGLDYALVCGCGSLAAALRESAVRWHGRDRDAPIDFEPSLTDFLSPTLAVASLMAAVLATAEFADWVTAFLPRGLGPLAEPPRVADRGDPQIVHLDGLSLSRSWMLGRIAAALPAGYRLRVDMERAAGVHLAAGLPQAAGGDYVGEHWLASFAALALGDAP
jgi:hypothetical protein